MNENGERLFTRPSFYAEFAALENHGEFVDSIYILRDQGLLTADRLMFASPHRELTFCFRESVPGAGYASKVIVNEPKFGHRKKGRAFFGWVIGIKFNATWSVQMRTDDPMIAACQNSLARVIGLKPSYLNILEPLDNVLRELSENNQHVTIVTGTYVETSQGRVSQLASRVGGSERTLHRRLRTSTGFSPKRFLAMQRFRRSIYKIVTPGAELSEIALDLGFADQAHLTRDFHLHAGLTPGAFKQAWGGRRAQVVRFLQDTDKPTRLRLAVWPIETTTKAG